MRILHILWGVRTFSFEDLETITAGLPSLLSEDVPGEISFGVKVCYLTLEKSRWVDLLLSKPMNLLRDKAYKDVIEKGFNINDTVHLLKEIYKKS